MMIMLKIDVFEILLKHPDISIVFDRPLCKITFREHRVISDKNYL